MYWIEFTISSLLIILAGVCLTQYADILGEKTRIAKAWIGVILLGIVTSLPEAVTSFVAIATLNAPDLAVGNILGSNTFNPLMIVVMDIAYRQGSITNLIRPNESHKYAVSFAIILNVLVILDLTFSRYFSLPAMGPLGIGNVLMILVYLGGMRYLGGLGMKIDALPEGMLAQIDTSYRKIWTNILLSAVIVIGAAVWLTRTCDTIAVETGLGQTFVGSLFLAIVTSLPEMVVVVSAVKLGSADLAIGNIFGSNMVNIFILAVCGLFNAGGPLLATVSIAHIFTAALGIVIVYLGWVGIQLENKKSFLGLGVDTIIMIGVFIIGMRILYLIR